jgi:hypothetical protein
MYSLLQDYFPADFQEILLERSYKHCCRMLAGVLFVVLGHNSKSEDWVLILSEKKCILNRVWESRNYLRAELASQTIRPDCQKRAQSMRYTG